MSFEQLSKLWTTLGLTGLFFTLNSWLATQGGAAIFGTKLLTSGRVPIALAAVPICSVLLSLTAVIGTIYARRIKGAWHARIPIVGFEKIDTASSEGRCYQASMICGVIIIPFFVLFHFLLIIADARVVTTGAIARELTSVWDWSGLTTINDPARACTRLREGIAACSEGASILPGLQPTLYLILVFGTAILVVQNLMAIVRRSEESDTFY